MNSIWSTLLKNGMILLEIIMILLIYHLWGPVMALIGAYYFISKNLFDIEEEVNNISDEIKEFKEEWNGITNLRKRI